MGRDDEWDIGVGLRRAVIHLLLWGAVCLAIWIGVVWLVTPWLDALPSRASGGSRLRSLVSTLIALPIAVLCIRLLYSKMLETAGFTSMVLSLLSSVTVWGVAVGGAAIAAMIRPPQTSTAMLWIGMGAIAMVWILYETFADR